MRIFTFIVAFCFCSLGLSAQDWTPFPYGQVTYWQNNQNGNISVFYNDSIQVGNVHNLHHFGKKYYQRNLHDSCVIQVYNVQSMYTNLRNREILEAFYVSPTGEWKYPIANWEATFLPNARASDSWSFRTNRSNFVDSVSITCTRKSMGGALGYTDSVKYFTVKSFWQGSQQNQYVDAFVLSKSAGFLRFVPFDLIMGYGQFDALNIFGFDHVSQGHFGFTSAWEDYYCIPQVGDVEYWDKSKSVGRGRISTSWRDSVTGVWVHRDTIVRQFRRELQEYHSYNGLFGTTVTQLSDTTIRSNWNLQVPNGVITQDIPRGGGEFFCGIFYFNTNRALELGFYNRFVFGQGLMGNNQCVTELLGGILKDEQYVQNAGLVREYESQMSGYRSLNLRGKRSCGRVYGTLTLGNEELHGSVEQLTVFTNPSNGKFNLALTNPGESFDLTVTDLLGRIILARNLSSELSFDLEDFANGCYIVKVLQSEKTYIGKFFKH